jgi:hypothetical protein
VVEDAERHRKLIEGPLEQARRLGLLDPNSDIRRSIASVAEAHNTYQHLFRRPEIGEIDRLVREALNSGGLSQSVLGAAAQMNAVQAAMTAMKSPWLSIGDEVRSAQAFSDLFAIGRGLAERPPFETAMVEALRSSLGDWRELIDAPSNVWEDPFLRTGFYHERGLDPRLTDFTFPAFTEGTKIAGLHEREEAPIGADEEDGLARSRQAFDHLLRFEIAVRQFIERVMQSAFGDTWMKRQLPKGMLENWVEKRDRAVKAGQAEEPLINYADFTDYRQIIERRDNWETVFKMVFGRPEDI